LTYHRFDRVTLRSGDGYTGTAFCCIVPSLEREGSAEEVAWDGVAGERACSAGDVAAVEGGFAGVPLEDPVETALLEADLVAEEVADSVEVLAASTGACVVDVLATSTGA
jgi:hypothetical protein